MNRWSWSMIQRRAKRISESYQSAEDEKKKNCSMKNLPKTAEELDKRFDEGEDLEALGFDFSKATRPNLEVQRVNVDFPKHFLQKLDREAELRGISRQALIKTWLYERLQFATAGNVVGISSYRQLTGAAYLTFAGGAGVDSEASAPKSGVYEAATSKLLSGVKTRSK